MYNLFAYISFYNRHNNNNNNTDNNNNNNNNNNKKKKKVLLTDGLRHLMWFSIGHCIKKKQNIKILKMDELRNVTLRKNLLRFKIFK